MMKMSYNNKEKIADNFVRGIERYRGDKDLADFLEAYFMFMMQSDDLRMLNKDELSFTMEKLYGIIELRELLIKDKEVEVETEEPIVDDGKLNSMVSKIKNLF